MFLMRILVIWYKIIVWVKKQICQWRYDWLGEKVLSSSASLSWLPQPLVCLHNFSFLNLSSKHRKETQKKSKLVVLFFLWYSWFVFTCGISYQKTLDPKVLIFAKMAFRWRQIFLSLVKHCKLPECKNPLKL